MTELELNKEYTYPQICETVGWEQTTGNSRMAQIREIEAANEYYHPINKKTHKPKKSYIFTRKLRDMVEPSKENSAGNNRKNIQPMIEYLQAKFDLDDNWYSFTDWYCNKLELMNKTICNAVYHSDEIDAVCEKYDIADDKLFCEYVSAVKSELKNMFLKSLAYLEKKDKITYYDEYKFIYRLGKRTIGYVITDCINDTIKEIETIVCNDLNEDYVLSKKMKGRQLLKVIYSQKRLTEDFKELCLLALNDDNNVLKELNEELSHQHATYHPVYNSICNERPIIDYRRGISITDMELEEGGKEHVATLTLDITNRVRNKVRKSLRKSYRKFMKHSDIEAVEKALFQYYDDKFDDGFLYLTEDDISDIEQIFGGNDNWGEPVSMERDFSIEEILDMPPEGEVQMNLPLVNTDCVGQDELCKVESPKNSENPKQDIEVYKTGDCREPNYIEIDNESHDKSNHGIFCVTGKDSEIIDIDDLY